MPDVFRAQTLNDALDETQKSALSDLLRHDPALGQSRLTWLRGLPHSTQLGEPPRTPGQAEVRARARAAGRAGRQYSTRPGWPGSPGKVQLPRSTCSVISASAAVSPPWLPRCLELDTALTDAAIAMFERLTGYLFTRSKNRQERSWSASKPQVGRLIRLFGGTLDAMVRARQHKQDPFAVLDEEIGWDRLLRSREEIASFGDLATEDALPLAAGRYTQLRRFAPAFLEAFDFKVPEAGQDLQAALDLLKEHNRAGKRNLPDALPMPFASQHWKSLIPDNGRPGGASTKRQSSPPCATGSAPATCGWKQPRLPPLRTPICRHWTRPGRCLPTADSRPMDRRGWKAVVRRCVSACTR